MPLAGMVALALSGAASTATGAWREPVQGGWGAWGAQRGRGGDCGLDRGRAPNTLFRGSS
jgi:hypothetical protein